VDDTTKLVKFPKALVGEDVEKELNRICKRAGEKEW